MCEYGFFDGRLFEKCLQCGENGNSRTHATNVCSYAKDLKASTVGRLKRFIAMEDEKDLEKTLTKIFFNPDLRWKPAVLSELVNILKVFAATLYIERPRHTNKKPVEELSYVSE